MWWTVYWSWIKWKRWICEMQPVEIASIEQTITGSSCAYGQVYHLNFWWSLPVPVWPIPVSGCFCQLRPSEHGQRPQFVVPDELRGTWHNSDMLCDAMLASVNYALLVAFLCFSRVSHSLGLLALFRLGVKYLYALQQFLPPPST